MKRFLILGALVFAFLNPLAGAEKPLVLLTLSIDEDLNPEVQKSIQTAMDQSMARVEKEFSLKITQDFHAKDQALFNYSATFSWDNAKQDVQISLMVQRTKATPGAPVVMPRMLGQIYSNPRFSEFIWKLVLADFSMEMGGVGKEMDNMVPLFSIAPGRLDSSQYPDINSSTRALDVTINPRTNHPIIAGLIAAFEFNENLEFLGEVPGSNTAARAGEYILTVDVSDSGIVYTGNTGSPELLAFIPGNPNPRRPKVERKLGSRVLPMKNGALIFETNSGMNETYLNLYQNGKKTKLPVPYFGPPAEGPEGTLIMLEPLARALRIYDLEGALLDLVPLQNQSYFLNFSRPKTFSDGTYGITGMNQFAIFDQEGRELQAGKFTGQVINYAFSENPKRLYTLNQASGMLECFFLAGRESLKPDELELLKTLEVLKDNPEDLKTLKKRAELLKKMNQMDGYKNALQDWLAADPDNLAIQAEINRVVNIRARETTKVLSSRTLENLKVGQEHARSSYESTLYNYEKLLFADPSDEDILKNYRALKQAWRDAEGKYDPSFKPLGMQRKFNPIFPALYEFYKKNPLGEVTLKNPFKKPVTDVEVEFFIPNYSSAPVVTRLAELKAEESKTLGPQVALSPMVLDIQENIPVQGKLTVRWKIDGLAQSMDSIVDLQIFRRTAMTWDNPGRMASFITPNEETVSTFAGRAGISQAGTGFSEKILRASRIINVLGTQGIRYTPDPATPLSRTQVEKTVVDTVRFPRTTLYQKSGDCDDTTALVCALFESVGINTAVVTSPGHVFMAFDTGEPEENAWIYASSEREVYKYDGRVWIPLETTILQKGFAEVWKAGADLIRTYKSHKDFSFTTFSQAREIFPPLPLPADVVRWEGFDAPAVEKLDLAAWTSLKENFYTLGIQGLERQAAGQSGKTLLKTWNRMAALHSRFGQGAKAEEILRKAVAQDPSFSPSVVNLGSLLLQAGKHQEALTVLLKGYEKSPDSVYLNLGLAQAYHNLGKLADSTKHYDFVRKNAPDLAQRFALVLGQSDSGSRAGTPGQDASVGVWLEP